MSCGQPTERQQYLADKDEYDRIQLYIESKLAHRLRERVRRCVNCGQLAKDGGLYCGECL